MSPQAARGARRPVRDQPGLRRAVPLRQPGGRRPDHAGEVAPSTTGGAGSRSTRSCSASSRTRAPAPRTSARATSRCSTASRPPTCPRSPATRSLRVIKATSIGYQGISLNIGNKNGIGKPFENVGTPLASRQLLRQAFELSLDRRVINRVVFGGTVLPGCQPVPPHEPVLRPHDPVSGPQRRAGARSSSSAPGCDTPVRVRLMIGTDQVAARLGQVIQSMAAEAGFQVTLAADGVRDRARPGRIRATTTRSRSAGPGASTRTATSTSSSTRRARSTTSAGRRRAWTCCSTTRARRRRCARGRRCTGRRSGSCARSCR